MLHPLDIPLDLLLRDTQQLKKTGEDPVPVTDCLGDGLPLLGQNQSTVALPEDESLGIKSLHHIGDTRLGDPQAGGDVDHPGIPLRLDQLLDPLEIIFGSGSGTGDRGIHGEFALARSPSIV